jgi:hypothetical protein
MALSNHQLESLGGQLHTHSEKALRDRYPFYILLASSSVLCAIAASTIFIGVLLTGPAFDTAVVILFVAFMVTMMSIALLAGIYETARQLERFETTRQNSKSVGDQLVSFAGTFALALRNRGRRTQNRAVWPSALPSQGRLARITAVELEATESASGRLIA